jgi:integrase
MSHSKSHKKKAPKRVLAPPDLEHAKLAVLNSLTSASGQRTYDHAIREFVTWYSSPKVLWDVVRAAAARAGIDKLAPHDLRRTRRCLDGLGTSTRNGRRSIKTGHDENASSTTWTRGKELGVLPPGLSGPTPGGPKDTLPTKAAIDRWSHISR